MSRTRVLSAAVLSVGLMTAAASAVLTPSVVYVPKTGTSSQSVGALANSRTFSVRITQSASEFFASGDLQFTTSGTAASNGLLNQGSSDTRTFGGPAGTDFDSYVTTPGTTNAGTANRTLVLGGGTFPLQHGAQVAQLPNATDPRIVDISWGDPQGINSGGTGPATGTAGTFEIARLTLKANTTATVAGRVVSITSGGATATAAFAAGATSFISAVLGDANNSGTADGIDLSILAGNFNSSTNSGVVNGDFNEDGNVDGVDLSILAGNFNFGVGPGAIPFAAAAQAAGLGALVPEPTSGLLLAGLAGMGLRRRR